MISCWSVHSKQRPVLVFSNTTEHSGSITQLKWSPSGKRLVTGDTVVYKLFD
jgi:WD40 repeat protein